MRGFKDTMAVWMGAWLCGCIEKLGLELLSLLVNLVRVKNVIKRFDF